MPPPGWALLEEALDRFRRAVGSFELADERLGRLLRDRELQAFAQVPRDGAMVIVPVDPEAWGRKSPSETIRVFHWVTYLVDRVKLDEICPPPGTRNRGGRRPKVDPQVVKAEWQRRGVAGEDASHGALAKHFKCQKRDIGRYLKK
jgi:hypothetical protein